MRHAMTTLALSMLLTRAALADIAPDPTNPLEPLGAITWAAVLGVIAVGGYVWYRRRK